MQGDFSVLHFDPHENARGVDSPAASVLRNLSGVLHQQGRVMRDADLTDGELHDLTWQGQAGRDIIGAGVCAVPAADPDGFRVEAAFVDNGAVHVQLHPGRAWVDGILSRLPGLAPDAQAAVERAAAYFGPPIAAALPDVATLGDGVRDAVVLEVSEEALNGFQYPERLIEPALGGPDTAERSFVNMRIRLLRLAEGEDCRSIIARLRDDPSSKGQLHATLSPTANIGIDCPVVGGGGFTGFEHALMRIEIAETGGGPVRFKWSLVNGSLVGRGRFDATVVPARVVIDAGRPAIVHAGLTSFYLEALQYDALTGAWEVVCGTQATLNAENDLDLTTPPLFGALPSTTDPVFFRLWHGIEDVSAFTNATSPQELAELGVELVFDAPANGNYRPGDYWTFPLRAGEIANPDVLLDHAPPVGIVYHRAPLAEINWTGRLDTRISGAIEDCRQRFRPLTNQKICCTFLIGDGISSFGDFNSLEQAAAHLPAAGGELCLLPGVHRANLRLEGRRDIVIHGCAERTLVLPREQTRLRPLLHFIDCDGIEVRELDLVTYDSTAVQLDASREGTCRRVRLLRNRMIARVHCIRANDAAFLHIADNRLHLLDTPAGLTTVSLAADDSLLERNTLVMIPFVDTTPDEPDEPDDDPTRDPADPCARPEILYLYPALVWLYARFVWTLLLTLLLPVQPYRAIGGIHLRAGCERVRLLENTIVGGGGNGVTLGGDLDPPPVIEAPPPRIALAAASALASNTAAAASLSTVSRSSLSAASSGAASVSAASNAAGRASSSSASASATALANRTDEDDAPVAVNVDASGLFRALVTDEAGQPQGNVDLYLEGPTGVATDRTDDEGQASIKSAPGRHLLSTAPRWRIVRVAETRENDQLTHAVTIAERAQAPSKQQAFLHEITIEGNNISMMGLSGIGFALRAQARLEARAFVAATNAKATLLATIDAALFNFAMTPLLQATHLVRDLVVLGNRIHHNLRNPFGDDLLREAQLIGRGGVSLAAVDSAAIGRNHIEDNGPTAVDPVCGIFVGWGNDVEISDNTLSGNGAVAANYEDLRRAGLRGGIYVRFAGALTTRLSSSSGRRPALRVHDNRVDHTAGRALTAFAFGPVSVANNHLSSEFTGRFGFLDTAFGGVLLMNMGGIHRLIARIAGGRIAGSANYAAASENLLPGGETIYDDNYVRLDAVNRSIISQALLCMDDLSYAANTSSVYRGDPFFCNTVLIADTLRATAGRLREDARTTFSMLSLALRANMTTLNQADHCIVALPPSTGTHLPRTVSAPNHVFDDALCRQDNVPGIGAVAAPALSAHAGQLGGTISADAFSAPEVAQLGRGYAMVSLDHVQTTQVTIARAYQTESLRLQAKLGANHPKTLALAAQAEGAMQARALMATGAEAGSVPDTTAPDGGAAVSGRLANEKGQGQPGYTVELIDANGGNVTLIGRTEGNGGFGRAFDANETAALARIGKFFPRVRDAAGREVLRGKDTVLIEQGAKVELALVLPLRVVPRSASRVRTWVSNCGSNAPTMASRSFAGRSVINSGSRSSRAK